MKRILATLLMTVAFSACSIHPRGSEDMRRDLCTQHRATPTQCVERAR